MWAPVALLLMVVATAVGSLGGEADLESATIKPEALSLEPAGVRISLEAPVTPRAVPASMTRSALHAAEAAAASASRQVTSAIAPLASREFLATEDPVFRSADLALLERAADGNAVDVLVDEQFIDGVIGNPQMFSTTLHRALTEGGGVGLEAGLQLPMFDDQPGLPSPELVVGIRVRF